MRADFLRLTTGVVFFLMVDLLPLMIKALRPIATMSRQPSGKPYVRRRQLSFCKYIDVANGIFDSSHYFWIGHFFVERR